MLTWNSTYARGIIILHHDILSSQVLEDQGLLPGTFYRLGAVPGTRDRRGIREGLPLSLSLFSGKKWKCKLTIYKPKVKVCDRCL